MQLGDRQDCAAGKASSIGWIRACTAAKQGAAGLAGKGKKQGAIGGEKVGGGSSGWRRQGGGTAAFKHYRQG